ncbi:hypothetical protein K7432_013016 [Basidiobolus ranarum]|uniref:Phosphotransferase n=1 Tax=Basidiobolus ranarum TaxID=34480 RepID=A0ABR2WJX3_9FUNG
MSAIESDPDPEHPNVEAILVKHFPLQQPISSEDRKKIHRICKLIATRSASIVGASIAALLLQANNKTVFLEKEEVITIGIDGSVYEFYPYFAQRIRRSMELILGPEKVGRIKLELARDGGCIGSALVAMVAATKQTQ